MISKWHKSQGSDQIFPQNLGQAEANDEKNVISRQPEAV